MGRPAFDTEFTVCRVHSLAALQRHRSEPEPSRVPAAPRLRAPEDVPTVPDALPKSLRAAVVELAVPEQRTRTENGTVVMNIRRLPGCEPTLDDPSAIQSEPYPPPSRPPASERGHCAERELPMWARPTVLAAAPQLVPAAQRAPVASDASNILRSAVVFLCCAALGGLIALAIATPEGGRALSHLVRQLVALIHA